MRFQLPLRVFHAGAHHRVMGNSNWRSILPTCHGRLVGGCWVHKDGWHIRHWHWAPGRSRPGPGVTAKPPVQRTSCAACLVGRRAVHVPHPAGAGALVESGALGIASNAANPGAYRRITPPDALLCAHQPRCAWIMVPGPHWHNRILVKTRMHESKHRDHGNAAASKW